LSTASATNSLWFRLIASAAVVSLVLLLAAAFLLSKLFESAVERSFDADLVAVLESVSGGLQPVEGGGAAFQGEQPGARYSTPFSGYYWQVRSTGEAKSIDLASPSLLDLRLEPAAADLAARDSGGNARFYMTDQQGVRLRAIEQRLTLFDNPEPVSFLATGNFDALNAEIASFRQSAFLVLGLLGLGLIAAIFAQVRFGLRPLRALQQGLSAIREGKAERMEGDYPNEIQPVAEELNLLIQSNAEVVERARTQVGNLAHALKTPLSILANEAHAHKGALGSKVSEQTQVMRDQVSLYLDRARRAARAQTLGAVTDVEPVLQALARTLLRISKDKGLSIKVVCPLDMRFRGEKQDLEEMAGNLLDNACKWAESEVMIEAARAEQGDGRPWLDIKVSDDGPGLPSDKWDEALKRGRRLDETKPGSGLGLSIVVETAAMYSGNLKLGQGAAGGLLSTLRLPAVQ
jgi:signal transduction histidine kinase